MNGQYTNRHWKQQLHLIIRSIAKIKVVEPHIKPLFLPHAQHQTVVWRYCEQIAFSSIRPTKNPPWKNCIVLISVCTKTMNPYFRLFAPRIEKSLIQSMLTTYTFNYCMKFHKNDMRNTPTNVTRHFKWILTYFTAVNVEIMRIFCLYNIPLVFVHCSNVPLLFVD